MNFQLRPTDFHSHEWLQVEANGKNFPRQMASRHKQLTWDLQIKEMTLEVPSPPTTMKQKQNFFFYAQLKWLTSL